MLIAKPSVALFDMNEQFEIKWIQLTESSQFLMNIAPPFPFIVVLETKLQELMSILWFVEMNKAPPFSFALLFSKKPFLKAKSMFPRLKFRAAWRAPPFFIYQLFIISNNE